MDDLDYIIYICPKLDETLNHNQHRKYPTIRGNLLLFSSDAFPFRRYGNIPLFHSLFCFRSSKLTDDNFQQF